MAQTEAANEKLKKQYNNQIFHYSYIFYTFALADLGQLVRNFKRM